MQIKLTFIMHEGFPRRLVLKQRHKVIRKWRIQNNLYPSQINHLLSAPSLCIVSGSCLPSILLRLSITCEDLFIPLGERKHHGVFITCPAAKHGWKWKLSAYFSIIYKKNKILKITNTSSFTFWFTCICLGLMLTEEAWVEHLQHRTRDDRMPSGSSNF